MEITYPTFMMQYLHPRIVLPFQIYGDIFFSNQVNTVCCLFMSQQLIKTKIIKKHLGLYYKNQINIT